MAKGKDISKAIQQLSDFKAPDFIWEQVSKRLDNAENQTPLQKAIMELPTHSAPPGVEDHLFPENSKSKRVHFNNLYAWLSGVAALLVFTVGILFYWGSSEKVTVTSSEEVITDPRLTMGEFLNQFSEEDEITVLVESQCELLVAKCQSKEFETLYQYYLELSASRQELIDAINHTHQLQLMDYLIRVEKEKTEIGKKLLQILIA